MKKKNVKEVKDKRICFETDAEDEKILKDWHLQ